ncbi:hypothetical protein QQF64_034236 [Cirrhinus molitorella]|uniref:Uncharacterized protein n=1 Tax=Cirrhinus molitorella TaxID=172907 RepID=A0ABR3MW51_9TELE
MYFLPIVKFDRLLSSPPGPEWSPGRANLRASLNHPIGSGDERPDHKRGSRGYPRAEPPIVARVQPRTSKGITNLLLLLLARLNAPCPSKKFAAGRTGPRN